MILGSVLLIGLNQIDKALLSFGAYNVTHMNWVLGTSLVIVVLVALMIVKEKARRDN